MKPAAFEYLRPATLDEAIGLLARHEGARPIAGGQSLLPVMNFRLAAPSMLVDIGRLPGLREIEIGAEAVTIGALVRWSDIERDPRLEAAHPLLAEAVRHVAHYQIRNRGTVGGSLAHADPAAELPGIAVACAGTVLIAGSSGQREVAAERFFVGALSTALEPGELIVGLRLPAWRPGRRWGFQEFSRRRGDFALAGAAVHFDRDEAGAVRDPHVGVIGANPRPIRLAAVEALLGGQAGHSGADRRFRRGGAGGGGPVGRPAWHRGVSTPACRHDGRACARAGGGPGMSEIQLRVNGAAVSLEVEPRLSLADCLRHRVGLTGTHLGCEHGVCGACTVIVDGEAVRSCLMLAVQADGAEIVTVEGLADGPALSPLQEAFRDHHALQCGFCTPGMLTTAHALLTQEPDADAERVREVLSGNLCRCTGYVSIVDAVLQARAAYGKRG